MHLKNNRVSFILTLGLHWVGLIANLTLNIKLFLTFSFSRLIKRLLYRTTKSIWLANMGYLTK